MNPDPANSPPERPTIPMPDPTIANSENGTKIGRLPNGKFAPGNNGFGQGGAKPNSGVKPFRVAKIVERMLDEPIKEGSEYTVVDLALRTLLEALTNRDEDGNVTPAAVAAARDVLDRRFGRARQQVDVNVGGGAVLAMIHQTAQARLEEMGRRHQKQQGVA